MATYMQGALKSGSNPSEYGTDVAYALFTKQVTLQAATVTNVDATITIPKNCQITEILVDNTVAWTATGAVALTAGITAGGTEYITTLDLKTITRGAPTLTLAQLAAMKDVGTNTNLVLRANSASGANAVGTTTVSVVFAPKL